ncbi:hypothetical protein LG047_00540 [Methylocystis sp. WRRC1]|uniref:hypothetical protein n=1 Tax=Methylocystis sp. WRRC1 TaxID=1732014 RepID=UPI001D14B397|nr:hypothetical protein [Methylocystis sp. WRRC1]MCC3243824.1 hypothetical protein [Methylocystis sp. WRRC1]
MFANRDKNIILTQLDFAPESAYTLIISGVQRGGTSMVAGVVRELGIDMGPTVINHEDPNFIVMQKDPLQEYVNEKNLRMGRWGFKLPGAHVNPKIRELNLRKPIWMFVFRNAVANMDSLLVHGERDIPTAFSRIADYYNGIMPYLKDKNANFILISYERAVADQEGFVKELCAALDLDVRAQSVKRAIEQITGDGGGYLPSSNVYHRIQLLGPAKLDAGDNADYVQLLRNKSVLKNNFVISYCDDKVGNSQEYVLEQEGEKPVNVSIILDFGEGFSGLAKYEYVFEGGATLIRVEHNGAVKRLGFGALGADIPNTIKILRSCRVSVSG